GHIENAETTPSRGPGRRYRCPVVGSGGANADLAVEAIGVGQGERRLGAGDLDEAVPPQWRIPAQHERGGPASGVADQGGDMGGNVDIDRGSGSWPAVDDPAVAIAAADGRDMLSRAEHRGQRR